MINALLFDLKIDSQTSLAINRNLQYLIIIRVATIVVNNMASLLSLRLQGILVLILLSLYNSYKCVHSISSIKNNHKNTIQLQCIYNSQDRDIKSNRQILLENNSNNLKFVGTLLGSLLLFPSISKAITLTDGVGEITIDYDGVAKPIKEYLGKKGTLIINVASQCALTPQYDDLVTLYDKYKDRGFTILGKVITNCFYRVINAVIPVSALSKFADMKLCYSFL